MEQFLLTDSESLYAKVKYQEKQLKLKRRWLMGLTLPDSEQQQVIKMKLRENKTLPESFLREDDQSMRGNQYVAVQEACDKTSIVAYRLIGNVLDEFAQIERCNLYGGDVSYLRGDSSIRKNSEVAKDDQMDVHDSIIIQALEELLPSFPESGKERVKELMGLK